MTRIRVIAPFRDKLATTRLYQPGEVVEFDDERAARIVGLSLGERVAPPRKPKPKKTDER